ncbi:conserved hypothetical protein [Ricinus communis]|uniref:Uncharacterized protein n=1 Tax=Ricinus communis TaxID=3988 RepID=B9T4K0_RICCO|nr:conserved hypothetical protein [Ricinus communis]
MQEEFVIPVSVLTNDEDDDLIEARRKMKEYGLREIASMKNLRSNDNLGEEKVLSNVGEDEIEGSSIDNEEKSYDYFESNDYGSYYKDPNDGCGDSALRRNNNTYKFDLNTKVVEIQFF